MKWIVAASIGMWTSAAADPITFRDAVDRAIAHNSDARVAADEIARAAALLQQASAALWPQVSAAVPFTRIEGFRFVAGHEDQAPNSVMPAIDVTAPILDLRLRANRMRAADQLDVSAKTAASVKRDVALAAARAYFAALTARQLVTVAEIARDTDRVHVDYAESRRAGGLGTELDVVRARTQVAADETQLASAVTAQIRAEEALGVVVGSGGPLEAIENDPTLERRSSTFELRADLVASRRRAIAAADSERASWTDYAPVVGVTGTGFLTAPQLDPIPRYGYQIVLTLSVQLFDGGYRNGLDRERVALLAEAREQLVANERQAHSEVRVADLALGNVRIAQDAAHRTHELAARALELANLAYHNGAVTNLEVIDAERTANDAAARSTIADDDLREAQLDLLASAGAFP